MFINTDGSCPQGDSGCYYPDNPTVDRAQTRWPTDPESARWQMWAIVGHEVWHAVAGNFDPLPTRDPAIPATPVIPDTALTCP